MHIKSLVHHSTNVAIIICYLIITHIFHSLKKYLLSVYYVPGTIEIPGDIRENKEILALVKLRF